jgi:D-alanyl-D-alanine carboxypeptidase (penicillin-binding protein 5/6)
MNDEDQYIIENNDEDPQEENVSTRFPVKTQLLVLGSIMLLLFGSVIVPKTITLLQEKKLPEARALEVLHQEANINNLPQKIESLDIRAESSFVWDVLEQRAIFQKNADEEMPLASITKLMTALVAYELVPNDTSVTISRDASLQESGGNLLSGEVFEIKDLADFALISSSNSAAYTLADSVGALLGDRDSVGQFVAGMNIRASELKLNSLKFLNPTGLDVSEDEAGALGSARDVVFLVEYILKNHPEILTPTIMESTRLYNTKGEYHTANNTDEIVLDIPNLMGSKTGYTDLAGGNLVIAFDTGFNRPVIVAVLGSTRSERFTDVLKIIDEVQNVLVKDK